jgi:hypothetical protein
LAKPVQTKGGTSDDLVSTAVAAASTEFYQRPVCAVTEQFIVVRHDSDPV